MTRDSWRELLRWQQQHRLALQGLGGAQIYKTVRHQCRGRRLGRHQLERTVLHTWYNEGSRWQVSALSGDHMDADLPSSIPLRASHNLHLCSAVHHLAWAQSQSLEDSKKEIKLGTGTNMTKE